MSPRSLCARTLVAIFFTALLAGAQSPLVVKSNLVVPCNDLLSGIADYDGNGTRDFLEGGVASPAGVPVPSLKVVLDPVALGGGACQVTPISVLTTASGISAFSANLNGDAHPDAVVRSASENRIIDAYGNGAGGFVFPGTGAAFTSPGFAVTPIVVSDFDLDGRDDLLIFKQGAPFGTLEVFMNLATPGWTLTWSYLPPTYPNGFGAGDVDGDGIIDLVWVENDTHARLKIARGDGVGGFTVAGPVTISPISGPAGFTGSVLRAVGDLDGDGMADSLVSPSFSVTQPMSILFGAMAPALPTLVNISTPHASFYNAVISDFDRDGIADIVEDAFLQVTGSWRTVIVFRGLGARQFSAPIVLDSVDFTSALFSIHKFVAADLDGDQDVEILRSFAPLAGAAATFTLYENQTVYGGECPSTGGTNPTISVGLATPGNAAFAIGLEAALPLAPAVLGLSFARSPVTGCGLGLDLGLANLLLPTPSLGVTTTDATGAASIGLPIPAGIAGIVVYAQWGVVDPAGSFGFGGQPFALTRARTILAW